MRCFKKRKGVNARAKRGRAPEAAGGVAR